ncbi:MAG: hypothetical protein K8S98_07575 [Planctomycetes bacterium]|nr:hypothetical protein [Planctomycetota bacterium]
MKSRSDRGTSFASVAVLVGALFVADARPRQAPDRAKLATEVRDATVDERVVIEAPALGDLLACALRLDDDARIADLDAAARESLLTASVEHRGDVFRVRGTLVDMQTLSVAERSSSYTRGRMKLETGGDAYFVAAELPLGLAAGDFVRFDGFFMKVHSRATDDAWLDAPLFVAPRLARSVARLEPQSEIDVAALAQESDETLDDEVRETNSDAEWRLLAYATNPAARAIDWSAARELDAASLASLLADGAAARGEAFRIDAARIARCENVAPGENPLRFPLLASGWLGSWSVDGRDTLAKFVAATESRAFVLGDAVAARGFFLRNVVYERRDGEKALAPLFVLQALEPRAPVKSAALPWLVGGALAAATMLVAIFVSLRRAARGSPELQAELARRRSSRTDGA